MVAPLGWGSPCQAVGWMKETCCNLARQCGTSGRWFQVLYEQFLVAPTINGGQISNVPCAGYPYCNIPVLYPFELFGMGKPVGATN